MARMRDWNELYTRYLRKQCSPEEIRLLMEHFRIAGNDSELQSRISAELANTDIPRVDTPETEAAFDRIQYQLMERVSGRELNAAPRARWTRWLPYAAALLITGLAGMWFLTGNWVANQDVVVVNAADIGPGGNRATLTLADGSTVNLSEAQSGIIVGEEISYLDGSVIIDNGQLTMDNDDAPESSLSSINYRLSTPKGGTYQITLSDGTNVWLNSASTLTYPAQFEGNERVVELEGEAYFEVRNETLDMRLETPLKSTGRPFRVISKGQTVEVLGTQFNISAYADEAEIKTTLVEGRVKVNAAESPFEGLLLVPGEQAILTGTMMRKQQVDVEQFIAWKDGLFSFRETELHAVMSQLSRWYDVTIAYQDNVPTTHYYGAISRNESLAGVLELLQQSGLNFKIERADGTHKLTVLP